MFFLFSKKLVDPFADYSLEQPPQGFWAFMWYYTRPVAPLYGGGLADYGIDRHYRGEPVRVLFGDLVNWFCGKVIGRTFVSDHGGELFVDGAFAAHHHARFWKLSGRCCFIRPVMGKLPHVHSLAASSLFAAPVDGFFFRMNLQGRVAQKVYANGLGCA